jgi:hypothetical protein
MTWFHIVCFDARFSVDSVWERSCKVVHFSTFTGFALVGYKFNLFVEPTPHWVRYIYAMADQDLQYPLTSNRSFVYYVGLYFSVASGLLFNTSLLLCFALHLRTDTFNLVYRW